MNDDKFVVRRACPVLRWMNIALLLSDYIFIWQKNTLRRRYHLQAEIVLL